MVVELVAQGESIDTLPNADALFGEGEEGEVRIYLRRSLSPAELSQLEEGLKAKGAVLTGPIQQVSTIVSIPFRRELAFLILLAPLLAALAGGSVIGWQLLKGKLEWVSGALLIGGGAVLLLLLLLSRRSHG